MMQTLWNYWQGALELEEGAGGARYSAELARRGDVQAPTRT